ncbi:hypothetical protein AAG906_009073 [Vitis piasezkii]
MTILFQANEEHSSVMTPLEIPWESLTHSNTWNFKQISTPKPIKHRKPLYITQDDKGDVVIQFPSKEIKQSSRISIQESAQGSTTSSPPRYSVDSRRPTVKLDNVDFAPNVPYPRYVKQESSPPTSPTPSQIKIAQLDLSNKASSSNTKSINVIEEITPENVDEIQAMFEEKDPQINKIVHKFKQQSKTRNFYPRPTPPDLQYEERKMIMASTAYKSRGNLDPAICFHLIAGFTGQLKGWWDNALTEEEMRYIQKNGIRRYTLPKYTQGLTVTNPIGKRDF